MLMGMSGTEPGSGRLLKICLNFPWRHRLGAGFRPKPVKHWQPL